MEYARTPMRLTIHVPDDMLENVKEKLSSQPTGVLETIALDAVLDFLITLREADSPSRKTTQPGE